MLSAENYLISKLKPELTFLVIHIPPKITTVKHQNVPTVVTGVIIYFLICDFDGAHGVTEIEY